MPTSRTKWLVFAGLLAVSASFIIWQKQPTLKTVAGSEIKINTPATQTAKPNPQNLATALPPMPESSPEKPIPQIPQLDFEELQALPTQTLWEHWSSSLQQAKLKPKLETAVLIQKLRQGGHAAKAIYKELDALIRDASLSASQRAELVNLLGETSTPEAITLLAKLLHETDDEPLRYTIADAIGRGPSGLSEWELNFHPELSPILESLWQQLEPDPYLANALAKRIASEGAVSGVKLMLEQIGQDGQTLADLAQTNNPRTIAALNAMAELRNPEALPLLKQTFQSQALDSVAFNASGAALAAMANVEATKTLLDWARQAPDEASAQAQQWLSTATGNDPDSSKYIKKALAQNDAFQSPQIKQTLLDIMAEQE